MPVKSFRAWNKRSLKWMEPFGTSMMVFEAVANHEDSPRDLIIEIGTGITDCRDCEIFEGDIVSIDSNKSSTTSLVSFERGMMVVSYVKDGRLQKVPLAMFGGRPSCIIGNIHDNPDRLRP